MHVANAPKSMLYTVNISRYNKNTRFLLVHIFHNLAFTLSL